MFYRQRFASSQDDDTDPLSGVANLFDVAMVFAVALLVAMVSYMRLGELLTKENVTIVKNPGKADMEIIRKQGTTIEHYRASGVSSENGSQGKKIGSAYQMDNGEVIYVPEE
jgi:hypothetical protein